MRQNKALSVSTEIRPVTVTGAGEPHRGNKEHFHTGHHFNAGEVRLLAQSSKPQSFPLTHTYAAAR